MGAIPSIAFDTTSANTSDALRPLLLHFHPLVIYRYQVIKQADVVLALLLQGQEFTPEQKRHNFEYYDALTTGDSTLSASTQSIIAAEVGYAELALRYFLRAAFVDLADSHRNTVDGLHVASLGGVWSSLVFGFGGMRDHNGVITFDPRLPAQWPSLTFRITYRGSRIRCHLEAERISFTVETGDPVELSVQGRPVFVDHSTLTVALSGAARLMDVEAPAISDLEGTLRDDGTLMTASTPSEAY